jgi:hypothetical protein
MSWLYSQALVAAYSAESCSDGVPCAPSSSTNTHAKSSQPDKMTDAWNPSLSGTMCKPSTASRGEELLMSFRAGFPVRTSASREKAKESTENDQVCGHTWRELWMKWNPSTSSWKTHRCLWEEDLRESSVILPRWGMMHDGELWERVTLALPTREKESGSWPTPTKDDGNGYTSDAKENQMQMLRRDHRLANGGILNPEWVEWLMGWPIGWTGNESTGSAMDKFRQWLRSHGVCSPAKNDNDKENK